MKRGEIRKHGKQAAEWRKVRDAWVRDNPPNHQGQYVCALCGKSAYIEDMDVDHIIPRSGDPASRYDFANLQPTHSWCNSEKSSRRVQSVVSPKEYALRKLLDL